MGTRTLTLPMLGLYFDQIRDGEKVEEYRLVTDFYRRRLFGKPISKIVLTRGYPAGGGILGKTRMEFAWRGVTTRTIIHPHFHNTPALVYVIDVSERIA